MPETKTFNGFFCVDEHELGRCAEGSTPFYASSQLCPISESRRYDTAFADSRR